MTKLTKALEEIRERAEKAKPFTDVTANLPFYVVMNKPRPSLSKHDSEQPTFWHPDDALFLIHAQEDIPALLRVIEKLVEQRNNEIKDWHIEQHGHTENMFLDVEHADTELLAILNGDGARE